jgi:hypothetical protein
MKKNLKFLAICLAIFFSAFTIANAQANGNTGSTGSYSPFKLLNGVILPQGTAWTLKLPYLGGSGTQCVQVDNNGLLAVSGGTCGGSGGSSFPFTPTTNYNSTSTVIGFLSGLFSNSTTTINNNLYLPTLSTGLLYTTTNGRVDAKATSTPTVTAPITYSGTLGSFVGGSSGTFACATCSTFAFPFTPTTNYNVNTNSTTTPIWFQGSPISLTASSTAILTNASSTQLTVSGQSWLGAVNFAGNILASTDNTYDIGASGATRPRTIYAGTDINAGAQLVAGTNLAIGGSSYMYFTGRSIIRSPSDGVIKISNAAENDFTALQFGGTTSSFVELKRAGTTLQLRLADDSDNADFQARAASLSSTLTLPSTGTLAWGSGSANGDLAQIANGVTRLRTTGGNGISLSVTTDGQLTIRDKTNANNGAMLVGSTTVSTTLKIATSTPYLNSALSVTGTTTVVGQINSVLASTTAGATSPYTVDWSAGNTQKYTLSGSNNFIINATSSNPVDGGKYVLKICNATGSATFTFATPLFSWYNGTTTANGTVNMANWIGMIWDAREQKYNVIASTTVPCIP